LGSGVTYEGRGTSPRSGWTASIRMSVWWGGGGGRSGLSLDVVWGRLAEGGLRAWAWVVGGAEGKAGGCKVWVGARNSSASYGGGEV